MTLENCIIRLVLSTPFRASRLMLQHENTFDQIRIFFAFHSMIDSFSGFIWHKCHHWLRCTLFDIVIVCCSVRNDSLLCSTHTIWSRITWLKEHSRKQDETSYINNIINCEPRHGGYVGVHVIWHWILSRKQIKWRKYRNIWHFESIVGLYAYYLLFPVRILVGLRNA